MPTYHDIPVETLHPGLDNIGKLEQFSRFVRIDVPQRCAAGADLAHGQPAK